MNCQTAKPLLLDYVYGALESVESQPLERHLTDCGPCQQALVWTKSCQIKLKQASLEAFPELQFQAETLLNPLFSAPSVKARKWSSSRWAFLVAAAVLILLFPVWFLFLNQENGHGPSGQEFVFADQDGRKAGLELAQLELVFKEAVALAKDPNRVDQAQSNFSKAHVALSVDDPKTNDFGPKELKTILFLPQVTFSPGSQVEVQSISLKSADLSPVGGPLSIRYVLKGPGFEALKVSNGMWFKQNNQPALFGNGTEITGMGRVVFDLPGEVNGGPWEIEVSEAKGRFPSIQKKIQIEGMKSGPIQTARWDKTSYKPGDRAKLTIKVTNSDGTPLPDAKVGLTIILGGKPWNPESNNARKAQMERISDTKGLCELEFVCPQKPENGQNEILIQSRIGDSFLSEKQALPF